MSRLRIATQLGVLCLVLACDQLGNPPQFATAPTPWNDELGHLVTTTRSFRNEKTILRLVSEGLGELDHVDPSIGPSQTLTLVSVAHRRLKPRRGAKLELVTIFKLPDRAPILRRWVVPKDSHQWNGAFALPEPPAGALTSVAP